MTGQIKHLEGRNTGVQTLWNGRYPPKRLPWTFTFSYHFFSGQSKEISSGRSSSLRRIDGESDLYLQDFHALLPTGIDHLGRGLWDCVCTSIFLVHLKRWSGPMFLRASLNTLEFLRPLETYSDKLYIIDWLKSATQHPQPRQEHLLCPSDLAGLVVLTDTFQRNLSSKWFNVFDLLA